MPVIRRVLLAGLAATLLTFAALFVATATAARPLPPGASYPWVQPWTADPVALVAGHWTQPPSSIPIATLPELQMTTRAVLNLFYPWIQPWTANPVALESGHWTQPLP